MFKSKLSRWIIRSAFTLAAVATVSVLSAEQANAQFYGGGRGISVGSFRGGGISVNYGNRSSFGGYGYGGGRGYSGYSRGFNNYYRPSYGGSYRGRGGYGSSYYRRGGGFRY